MASSMRADGHRYRQRRVMRWKGSRRARAGGRAGKARSREAALIMANELTRSSSEQAGRMRRSLRLRHNRRQSRRCWRRRRPNRMSSPYLYAAWASAAVGQERWAQPQRPRQRLPGCRPTRAPASSREQPSFAQAPACVSEAAKAEGRCRWHRSRQLSACSSPPRTERLLDL